VIAYELIPWDSLSRKAAPAPVVGVVARPESENRNPVSDLTTVTPSTTVIYMEPTTTEAVAKLTRDQLLMLLLRAEGEVNSWLADEINAAFDAEGGEWAQGS
jgi:hypothetical protein